MQLKKEVVNRYWVSHLNVFTSNFGKIPVTLHLGKDKYFFHYIWENKDKTGKNEAIFGLGMPPVTGGKTGQIKSLHQACTLSHNIYVASSSFITNDIFLIDQKSLHLKSFLNLNTKSP